ncbi:YhbY family RNA-binding protein [Salinisphaera sp. RV14]|uniref:YhbY family RNA-binding protein n=1 Tax=unclassified Salinisphaera TaxID=2649847 RepID=UPI003F85EDA2
MPVALDKSTRLALKKQAHHLKPIVQSGAAGLSEGVLAEMDRALTDHELVKVKLVADDKASFNTEVEQACAALDAACVQQIGRTATLYRPNPEKSDG